MQQNSLQMAQFHTTKVSLLSAFSNWIGDIIFYPIDANKYQNFDTFPYIKNSILNEGSKIYKGVGLSFPATFIPSAIYISIYDTLLNKTNKIIDKYTNQQEVKLIFPFFISMFAQFVCLWFYLPVDTVRTRIQINHPNYQYSSLFYGLNDIYHKEGFWRLYKSTKIYFVCKTMYTAIQFQTFQMIRFVAGPSNFWLILNTIASTAIATTILNPLQVLLTRYAVVDTTKKKLVFRKMVQRIYKKQGITGFYKGYATEMISHCFYALFWLPAYQILRQHYGVEIRD